MEQTATEEKLTEDQMHRIIHLLLYAANLALDNYQHEVVGALLQITEIIAENDGGKNDA